MFPALSALQAGYDVYGVIDASGTWSPLDQHIAVLRLVHAGVVVMNTANVLTELQYNHRRPSDAVSGHLFGDLVPALYYTGTQLRQHANDSLARANSQRQPAPGQFWASCRPEIQSGPPGTSAFDGGLFRDFDESVPVRYRYRYEQHSYTC